MRSTTGPERRGDEQRGFKNRSTLKTVKGGATEDGQKKHKRNEMKRIAKTRNGDATENRNKKHRGNEMKCIAKTRNGDAEVTTRPTVRSTMGTELAKLSVYETKDGDTHGSNMMLGGEVDTPLAHETNKSMQIAVPLDSIMLDFLTDGVSALRSRLFYDLQHQSTAHWESVARQIAVLPRPVRFPVWVRHHWIAVEVSTEQTRVFDSAASQVVRNDMRRLADRLGLPQLSFENVPQQFRGSNECGLFAATFLLFLERGLKIPVSLKKISLSCCQGLLTQRSFYQRARESMGYDEKSPFGGEALLSPSEIRAILQDVEIGSRVRHTFRLPQDRKKTYTWFGTVTSIPATKRRSVWKWKVRFDPYDEDDPDYEETLELQPLECYLPADPRDALSLSLEVVSRSASHVLHGFTMRDYAPPPEGDPAHLTDDWPAAEKRTCPDELSGQHFLDMGVLSYEAAQQKSGTLLAWGSLSQSVRRNHVSELNKLKGFIESHDMRHAHLQVYIDRYVAKRRHEGNLAWSTVSRLVGSLIGAFSNLTSYTLTGFHIALVRWPIVRDILTHATRLSAKEGSHEPMAASPAQVQRSLKKLVDDGHEGEAAAMALCWYSAQRPCDVLLLLLKNIKATHAQPGTGDDDVYVLKFVEGKVVGRIAAYHVHVAVPASDELSRIILRKWMSQRRRSRSPTLFDFRNGYHRTKFLTLMRMALRSQNNALELRSLRRGTLQMLSRAGVSESDLLQYSRHTTVQALRRYLGWEVIEADEHRRIMSKASVLAPSAGSSPDTKSFQPVDWIRIHADGSLDIATDHPPQPPTRKGLDRTKYQLLAKPETVIPINRTKFDAMAKSCSDRTRLFYDEAKTLRDDTAIYETVPDDTLAPVSTLQQRHVERSMEVMHTVPVKHNQRHLIKHMCRTFVTHEDEKVPPRDRMLVHTESLNTVIQHFPWRNKISSTTRRQARTAVLTHKGCISFDFAGWYQQIEVADAVSWHFCFKLGHKWYRYLRQPTGASWSADLATAHTLVLVDSTPPTVDVSVCIDNVRFAGSSYTDTVDAAWTFVQRCREVDAKLNDFDVYGATREDVARLFSEKDDFFGEVADYRSSTIACRPKHVSRLREYEEAAMSDGASCSTLFGLYAMLLYMGETLGDDLRQRLKVRLYFARRARDIARRKEAWDEPPKIPPPKACLRRWVALMSKNRPGRLVRAPEITHVVHVDACSIGYAALVVPLVGKVRLVQHKWTDDERARLRLDRSVNSEPEAVARVSAMLNDGGRHLYVTDHEQFVNAMNKGYSLSKPNNDRLSRLAPWSEAVYEPGNESLADPYSRFLKTRLAASDAREAVHRARVYADACRRGDAFGVVGDGRSAPSRMYRVKTPTQSKLTNELS